MVATIGGKMNKTSGIGTVEWKWKDDSGTEHTEQLEDVLYFPSSIPESSFHFHSTVPIPDGLFILPHIVATMSDAVSLKVTNIFLSL